MRVALITGSRDDFPPHIVFDELDALRPEDHFVAVIHGACGWDADEPWYWEDARLRGADRYADEWARERACRVLPYPAAWLREGRRAGPLRNERMVRLAVALRDHGHDVSALAFPVGASPGTRGCMRLIEAAGLPLRVVEVGNV